MTTLPLAAAASCGGHDSKSPPGLLDLRSFQPAPAELLAQRNLLARSVSKFLLPAAELPAVLEGLEDDYLMLRAGSSELASYRTIYFDTPDLRCYHDHRRGRRVRQKVRIRSYPERSVTFLEVKTRRSSFMALKQRLELPYGTEVLSDDARAFVAEHLRFPAEELSPQLLLSFWRATLLGAGSDERVTVDLDWSGCRGDRTLRFRGLAILEVKQRAYSAITPVMRALRHRGARQISFSKYCTGLALTSDGLRQNRFLLILRKLERMTTT